MPGGRQLMASSSPIVRARQEALETVNELSRAVLAARPQAMEDAARKAGEAASKLADTIRETVTPAR